MCTGNARTTLSLSWKFMRPPRSQCCAFMRPTSCSLSWPTQAWRQPSWVRVLTAVRCVLCTFRTRAYRQVVTEGGDVYCALLQHAMGPTVCRARCQSTACLTRPLACTGTTGVWQQQWRQPSSSGFYRDANQWDACSMLAPERSSTQLGVAWWLACPAHDSNADCLPVHMLHLAAS